MRKPGKLWVKKVWTQLTSHRDQLSVGLAGATPPNLTISKCENFDLFPLGI